MIHPQSIPEIPSEIRPFSELKEGQPFRLVRSLTNQAVKNSELGGWYENDGKQYPAVDYRPFGCILVKIKKEEYAGWIEGET